MNTFKTAYAEKLKDPRWQKCRLLIFERDNFTCKWCGDDKLTLHVHHIEYKKGCDPWEYENEKLMTLCEKCHEMQHLEGTYLESMLINLLFRVAIINHKKHLRDNILNLLKERK